MSTKTLLPVRFTVSASDKKNVTVECVPATATIQIPQYGSLVPMQKGIQWIVSVRIAADAVCSEPIEIMFESDAHAMNTRTIAIAERGASAEIFESFSGKKCTEWHHATEVFVEAEASLEFISLAHFSESTHMQSVQRSSVAVGGRIHWHCTTLGGKADEHELTSLVNGDNAKSSVDWIFCTKNKERQSVSVRNIFAARNGGGEITLKGVAENKSHAVCNGMIEITEQGGGTNTYLTENVLMLDPTAHTDAIPALEIRTNDVKASHSATISRVTEEDLFYLQSRGIETVTARRMFVEGFLSDLAGRITNIPVRDRVCTALFQN